jgi:hypothetical protein
MLLQEAESIIRESGTPDGVFLVRPSSKGVGCYAITMAYGGKVLAQCSWGGHVDLTTMLQILNNTIETLPNGQYRYVGPCRTFPTLVALVDHYMHTTKSLELRLTAYVTEQP